MSNFKHAPHQWNVPQYGIKGPKYMEEETTQKKLPTEGKTLIQKVFGNFFYCGLAIDITLLVEL